MKNVPNEETPLRQKTTWKQSLVASTSAALVSLVGRRRMEMPSRHVTSRHARLRCAACGQEHFLPTNATADELMRNSFLKTVKLRVHVALRQHANRSFLTGRYKEGRPLWFVTTHLTVHYNSSYWLSLRKPLAANANALPLL